MWNADCAGACFVRKIRRHPDSIPAGRRRAQDIAHGGVIQIQLQQGADALQPVHQRIAVDEKLPGRGMEVLLLQQVDAQGVQQGGAVGLVVLLQAAQHKATVS